MAVYEYIINADERFNFSSSEWAGIIGAGGAAAGISFVANSITIILHLFMTWYRPTIVNRLSLRMIVLSCVFNVVYCACQLVTDDIKARSQACRTLVYILIASDTMACMCLAMVGLNLVLIFVAKMSRSIKLELFYYFLVGLSGALVVIIPLHFGSKNGSQANDRDASCWYHYYFDGRVNNIFDWMWYYGWLLFSLVFAALCAVISICFVVKRQENFAGTLDMYSGGKSERSNNIHSLRKYTKNNTDIFQKIAIRCICYPLVPFFSKSWGVGIEIAASQNAYIPYPIFVLDRLFSCLLGFMVSCIYFTDPAIGTVFKEYKESIISKYVYDYYCVKYQPGKDPTIKPKAQYPQQVKIILNSHKDNNEPTHPLDTTLPQGSFMEPADISQLMPPEINTSMHKTDVPSVEVHKTNKEQLKHPLDKRRYSVVSMTSTAGQVFLPNQIIQDDPEDWTTKKGLFKRKNYTIIPMRLISKEDNRRYKQVEILKPFRFPKVAKLIHWMLVSLFKVKPQPETNDEFLDISNERVFHDYTDHSDPDSPTPSSPPATSSMLFEDKPAARMKAKSTLSVLCEDEAAARMKAKKVVIADTVQAMLAMHPSIPDLTAQSQSLPSSAPTERRSSNSDNSPKPATSTTTSEPTPLKMTLKRASTINVASLQRIHARELTGTPPVRPLNYYDRRPSSTNSARNRFGNLALSKLVDRGRSLSSSWAKRVRPKKSNLSTKAASVAEPVETEDSGGSVKLAPIKKDAFKDEAKPEEDGSEQVQMLNEPVAMPSALLPLSPFPIELSPRPVSQYKSRKKHRTSYRRPSEIGQSSSQSPSMALLSAPPLRRSSKFEIDKAKMLSLVSQEDDPLYSLTQIFDGQPNIFEGVQDIPTPRFTRTEEPRPVSLLSELYASEPAVASPVDEQEGLREGYTSIDFISSWDDVEAGDLSRFTAITEGWDLEEQLKHQLELAEEIAHL